ncbi:MAG: helix-turn-helix transcriptional regulator [Candidatus Nanohaloarchaea archaeon]
MRKLALTVSVFLFLGLASATTISQQEVKINLEKQTVSIEVKVKELTTESFTYLSSYPVKDSRIRIGGKKKNCRVESVESGYEISCPTDLKKNFTVKISFETSELTTSKQNLRIFQYSKTFYRPTESYRLKTVLPPGTALLSSNNYTMPIVSPADYETGSDGRNIFIEWSIKPQVGETASFTAAYERVADSTNYWNYLAIFLGLIIFSGGSYFGYRYLTRESIDSLYDSLDDDEVRVLKLLVENNGGMLQKDIVDELEYSKAKVSEVISGLVDEDILAKEKEGRSNKLKISRKYSY